jgi:hypothetical protein
MTALSRHLLLRSVLVATTGAAAYFALLWQWFVWSPSAPHWWLQFVPNAPWGAWLTVINFCGAILCAIPVAFGVVLSTKYARAVLALIIGLGPALYYHFGILIVFGLPRRALDWVWIVSQFFATGFAVFAIVALIQRFPLTIGSSNRGAASSVR